MHAKTDSEVTSVALSSPPRSPRRQIYYVMSPSHPDAAEKMSLGYSTPGAAGGGGGASPIIHHNYNHHHRYASSPIHHSRESSTTRFSASLKYSSWRKLPDFRHRLGAADPDAGDDDDGDDPDERIGIRCYAVLFVIGFVLLFSLFSLILWGASRSYSPQIVVKSVVFESYNIQAGMDQTGVATKMLTLNSTVRIKFRNTATFFGLHVSSTPVELYYYDLLIASGQMKEFYESRKSGRVVSVSVFSKQIPLYGAGSNLNSGGSPSVVPVDLTFVIRARAHILGKLVKSKFYRHVRCSLYLREKQLGKPMRDLQKACEYHN